MDLDLKALKIDKESSSVEAKSAQFALPKNIWDTYSAFANTNGGQIVLGVSEDSNTKELVITGIDDPDSVKKEFWDTINNPKKVSNNILTENDFNEITFEDGKTIFIIHVPKARLELRPIYINDDIIKGSFKRNHEGDYHLTRDDISKILRDASPYSYDLKVYDNLPLSSLSEDTINKYRRYHNAHKENHPWAKLPNEQYLLMIGATAYSEVDGLPHPTMAGLLMFGIEPVITRYFPDYFLDYRENLDPGKVRWTDRVQSISGEWSGNIFDFYLLVNNKLVMDFKVPFKLKGMERVDDTPLHDAAREAFINCLANADYFGRCGIVIRKNRDSIIYENPGSIRVGKEQMLQGGISDTRNKTIMKMFNLLGYGEKAGSGIPLIIQATKEFGLPMPQVDENAELDRTIFTISLIPSNLKGIVLDVMREPDTQMGAEIHYKGAENPQNSDECILRSAENEYKGAETSLDCDEDIKKGAEKTVISLNQKKETTFELIINLLKENKEMKSRDLASSLGLSLRRTRELLAEMIKQGKIVSYGSNEKKIYSLPCD